MKKILAIVLCMVIMVCTFSISVFAEAEVTPTDTEGVSETLSAQVVAYVQTHFEEVMVIVGMVITTFFSILKHKATNRSISATNHNAIAVSENSERTIKEALETINGYKEAFTSLLEEYRISEEEKQKLEKMLNEAMTYIKTAKLANTEFANELAELLCLANIPNSKKDELYSRHIAAVKAIAEAEKTEVNTNDGGTEA